MRTTARQIGLPGLVAQGVQVAGPAYAALLDAWGEDFLAHGELDVALRRHGARRRHDRHARRDRRRRRDDRRRQRDHDSHGGRRNRPPARAATGVASPFVTTPRAAPVEHGLHVDRSRRSVHDDHRRAGRAVRRGRLLRRRGRVRRGDARRDRRRDRTRRSAREGVPRRAARRPLRRRRRRHADGRAAPRRALRRAARRSARIRCSPGICRDLVGPDVRLYWEQAVYKQPHSTEPVLWHQDNGYTFVEPQAYLTCWIALTDATPENGCVVVMPGAHRDGTLAARRHADRASSAGATMTARWRSRCAPAASSCSRR